MTQLEAFRKLGFPVGVGLIILSSVIGGSVVALSRFQPMTFRSGIATVPPGDFAAIEFAVSGIGQEIYYQFSVERGPNIDVYIVTPGDFARYQSGLPFEGRLFAHEDVREASGSPYPKEGMYFAVIDNTDVGKAVPNNEAAEVRYTVDGRGLAFSDLLVLAGLVPVLLVGVVLMIASATFRKDRTHGDENDT